MKASYLLILLIILFPILLFFMTRGIVPHDEGYILNSADKIFRGYIPYRDFDFVYTPLSIFATALSFLIFQPSVLSSRILMLSIALVSSLLMYKIIIFSTRNKLYATLAIFIFASWGPSHINFAWPVMFAIFTSLLTLYLLLKFLDTRLERYLFISGFAAFSVFLTKQNFGAAILFPILALFLVKNMRKISYYLTFCYGYIWGIIIFCLFLLLNDTFAQFLTNFYDYTIKRILINERLSTGFIYKDTLVSMILRTSFYLLPVFVSVISLIILFIRRRFHLLFLPVFVIFFYLFGIRPTTDYVHLVPLISLIGIPISLFLRYNISTNLRLVTLLLAGFLIFLGFQTALFKGYYRWDYPLLEHNNYYKNPRVNIFLNNKVSYEFGKVETLVNRYTNKEDYIYINSYNPIFYFITQRREPTKSNILKTEINPHEHYKEVIGNLVAKKVKLLILDKNSLKSLPIKNYILANYEFLESTYGFDLYIIKP